jgi:hypothetical protein
LIGFDPAVRCNFHCHGAASSGDVVIVRQVEVRKINRVPPCRFCFRIAAAHRIFRLEY